jgi:hypothetical protein
MPIYSVHNIETGEPEEDFWGSWDSFQSYLDSNPHLTQTITAPNFVSGISGVTHKNDSGFGDMMTRIASANPHSPLAQTYGDKSIKASKTRDAVKKEKIRQAAKGL